MSALRPDQAGWLIAGAAVSLLPHAEHLPLWLVAICVLLLGWRGVLAFKSRKLPPRLLLTALSVALCAGVFFEYDRLLGKDPGIAMLAAFLCLKLLETHERRGARAAVLLALFMQMGQFFYHQGIAIAALALLGTVLSLAALFSLEAEALPPRRRLLDAGRLAAQGLPLMLVLFVLFPRVQGPLWGLPADAGSATTGLSDSMSPGAIASLSQSDAIAFRSAFVGVPPPASERYWRGPVLADFDGHTWRGSRIVVTPHPRYVPGGPVYAYTISLEAHDHQWLLALDFPGAVPGLYYSEDFQLLAREPLRSRMRLALQSYPHTVVGVDESPDTLRRALRLPRGFNPRTVALGAQLKREARSAEEIPARAVAYFRNAHLRYTLEPLPLADNDVDAFLFDTRQGFCEHFAAAFVVTLRAAGVPARVVTGYQGGELNPVDGSLEIRQSDAHAWTEAWLPGKGWVRIDPTAASAPQRIEGGLAAALPGSMPLLMRPDLAWLRALRYQFDALDNRWNQWVLGYNPARQRELFSGLGMGTPDWPQLTAMMVAACSVVMAALSYALLRQRRRVDPLLRAWEGVCSRLARRGLPRTPWEGPVDYAARIAAARPDLAAAINAIATDFAQLRYGRTASASDTAIRLRFHRSAKNFRPR